jgi:serine phosphatase RsbU (regulator of sigma subunit)
VLFSDGVTEAMDPDDQLFGVPRLRDVLGDKKQMPLEEIQKSVLEAVENFARGARQADDLTLLLIRYRSADVNVHYGYRRESFFGQRCRIEPLAV